MINTVLTKKDKSAMSVNSLITGVIISLASLDKNVLRWLQKFYQMKIGKELDFNKLRDSHLRNLTSQLNSDLN